jgi:hypothetical protein
LAKPVPATYADRTTATTGSGTWRKTRLKLNDPFGRVSKKNRRNYQALQDRLRQEGIRDEAAIARFTANMSATALKLAMIVCGLSLMLAVVFPHFLAALLGLDVLLLLWIGVGYFQTRMHLKRYAREECSGA